MSSIYARFIYNTNCSVRFVLTGCLIILMGCFQFAAAEVRDSLAYYPLHNLEREEYLLKYFTVYQTYHLNETPAQVWKEKTFKRLKTGHFSDLDFSKTRVYWSTFKLYNDRTSDSVFYLYNKFYNYWNLYKIIDNKPVFIASAGKNAPDAERNDSTYFYVCKIIVPPGDTACYLIKYVAHFYQAGFGIYIASPRHYRNGFYPQMVKKVDGWYDLLETMFMAVFIIFSLYSFLLFIQTRKRVYFSYATFQLLIYLPFTFRVINFTFCDVYYAEIITFSSLLQVVSYFFYFLFVEHFLKVKSYSPLISKILLTGRAIVVLYVPVVLFSYLYLNSDTVVWIFSIARGLMLLIGFSAIGLSFFKTIPLSGYIAAGSLTLAVCAGLSWYGSTMTTDWDIIPFMELGILVELLCFTLGLGAFSKLEEQQKLDLQGELIASLEEKRKIQEESLKAIIETQEAERSRIGRDLHDDVGAQLSTLKLFLGSIKSKSGKEQEELIDYSGSILDSAIHDIRSILINLSPKVLDEYGYVKAVEELVNKINSSNVLKFELSVHGLDKRLDPKLENSLYRITQELINNSLKYSWAKHIILDILRREDRIVLMYEDNGRGCDLMAASRGFGLTNIRTRVKMFNGQVFFDSSPGNGFRCEIEMDASV